MALTTGTISGPILSPDGVTRLNVRVTVRAVADQGTVKSVSDGVVLAGQITAQSANDGTLSLTLPQLPQAGVTPAEARWRATFELLDYANRRGSTPPSLAPVEFELTVTDTTWADLVDVSGVTLTQNLLDQFEGYALAAEAARDQAQTYRDETLVISGLDTVDQAIALLDAPVSGLVVHGDSTALGAGDAVLLADRQWAVLGVNMSLVAYRNTGVSGNASSDIALRQGGLDVAVAVPGDSIPASVAAITVTMQTLGSFEADAVTVNTWHGTLVGVVGTLANPSSGSWTFTPDAAPSSPVSCPSGSLFHCTENDTYRNHVQVLIGGTNNPGTGDTSLTYAVRDMDLMAAWCRAEYVIAGVHVRSSEAYTAAKKAYNALMLARYGVRFVDVGAYAVANGLALAGITPTVQDKVDITAGAMPSSLMNDNTHPNVAGYTVWRRAVEQAMSAKAITAGKVPSLTNATTPAAPVLSAATQTTLTATWTAVTGATGYAVEHRAVGTTDWRNNINTTGVTAVVPDLTLGTSYEVRYVPYNNAGRGTASTAATLATTGTPPVLLASDNYSGADSNMTGQAMDMGAGGSLAAPVYAATNTNQKRQGNKYSVLANGQAWVNATQADARIVGKIGTLGTGNQYLKLRMASDGTVGYQAQITSIGQLKIVYGTTVLAATNALGGAVVGNEVIEFSAIGSALKVVSNGVTMLTVTDSTYLTGTYVGAGGTQACNWDDLRLYNK